MGGSINGGTPKWMAYYGKSHYNLGWVETNPFVFWYISGIICLPAKICSFFCRVSKIGNDIEPLYIIYGDILYLRV